MKKLIAILVLVHSLNLFSQDSLMVKFNNLNNDLYKSKPINYLSGLELLNTYESVFKGTQLESFFQQVKSGFYTQIGKSKQAKEIYKFQDSNRKTIDLKKYYINKNVKEVVLKRADNRQMVMINENHVYPEHRVFTTSLLEGLYKNGYRYLALEDLSAKQVKDLNERVYPKEIDGLYINEVMYAQMVRTAREIGFTLVAYDDNMAWDISERDSIGASELKKVFKKDTRAKVVVHCGFGHIDITKNVLAKFVKRDIGITPLIINQVNYLDVENILDKLVIVTPKNENDSDAYLFPADIQVVHPDYDMANDRAEYLFMNNRVEKSIDLSKIKRDGQIILEIRVKGEDELAVPLDKIVIDKAIKEITVSTYSKGTEAVFINSKGRKIKTIQL